MFGKTFLTDPKYQAPFGIGGLLQSRQAQAQRIGKRCTRYGNHQRVALQPDAGRRAELLGYILFDGGDFVGRRRVVRFEQVLQAIHTFTILQRLNRGDS
jgi:hypothetical protein